MSQPAIDMLASGTPVSGTPVSGTAPRAPRRVTVASLAALCGCGERAGAAAVTHTATAGTLP